MNKQLSTNLAAIKKLALGLLRWRSIGIIMLAAAITAYSLYQARQVLNLEPSRTTLADERQKVVAARVKFDVKALETINQLRVLNIQTSPVGPGKSDPFSP